MCRRSPPDLLAGHIPKRESRKPFGVNNIICAASKIKISPQAHEAASGDLESLFRPSAGMLPHLDIEGAQHSVDAEQVLDGGIYAAVHGRVGDGGPQVVKGPVQEPQASLHFLGLL